MPNTPRLSLSYPNPYKEDWWDIYVAQIEQLDGHLFAAFEDRGAFVTAGGEWTFDDTTGELEWGGTLRISSPSTGAPQDLEPGSVTLLNGQFLWVQVVRGATGPVGLSAVVSSTVPVADASFPLALRNGTKVYFRNGIVLADEAFAVFEEPAPFGGGGGGGGESLAQTLVIGNTTGGRDIILSDGDALRGFDTDGDVPGWLRARAGYDEGSGDIGVADIGYGNEVIGLGSESTSVLGNNNNFGEGSLEDAPSLLEVVIVGHDNYLADDPSPGSIFGSGIFGSGNSLVASDDTYVVGVYNDVSGVYGAVVIGSSNNVRSTDELFSSGPAVIGSTHEVYGNSYGTIMGWGNNVYGSPFALVGGNGNSVDGQGSPFHTGEVGAARALYDDGYSEYEKASSGLVVGIDNLVSARNSVITGRSALGQVANQIVTAAGNFHPTSTGYGHSQVSITPFGGRTTNTTPLILKTDRVSSGLFVLRQNKTYMCRLMVSARNPDSGPISSGELSCAGWDATFMMSRTGEKFASQDVSVVGTITTETLTIGGVTLTAGVDFSSGPANSFRASQIRDAILDSAAFGVSVGAVIQSGTTLTVVAYEMGAPGESVTISVTGTGLTVGGPTLEDAWDSIMSLDGASVTIDGMDLDHTEDFAPVYSVASGSTWRIRFGVDQVTRTFRIRVTGEAATEIMWSGILIAAEVGGDISVPGEPLPPPE